jgi:membrane-associated phospholipid phosphatase
MSNRNRRSVFVFFFVLLLSGISPSTRVFAQNAATTSATPSLSEDRSVSLREFPANILADQKSIWLFPVSLAHAEHILPTVGIVGATTVFIATDAHSAPPFRNTTNFNGFNDAFSSLNSAAMIAAAPAMLYGLGLLHKNSYAQDSALLAAEAVADEFIVDLPFKAITGRRQPINYFGPGPYTSSFFNGSHNPFHSGGFFSDHAAASMAVATVLAHRYRQHRWVPYVAYGLAAVISFSRVTTSNHFPADAFFGGAMGFVIARYAVLPPR